MQRMWQKKQDVFIILLSCLFLLTTACGFSPLYNQSNSSNARALASVKIFKIKNRSGQKLRNYLLERISPNQRAVNPKYSLRVSLAETIGQLNIRKDGSATRAKLAVTATFTLRHIKSGKNYQDKIISTSSYNILGSDFATLGAENDARNRALRSIAEDLRLRIAVAIKTPYIFGGLNKHKRAGNL